MNDRIGQPVGNYRLVRLLGQGGFAEVYLGEHRYLKSHAALKVLRCSLKDEEAKRFLAEAQTLVRLTHPNIVRVLEFAVERGTPVLVMDYAPGGTARQRHPRGSRLSLVTTVAYVKQVAAALQYAHNNNVIHRDVKPENILFSLHQHLLLGDFGLALLTPSPDLLSTQEMAGTVPYTAPEQLRGKPSFASDQYALGIITYEWLCGRRPFEGTQWEVVQQHLSNTPPPLREMRPELPEAVETVLQRALAKDPRQRFVSVQAFALALERASQEGQADSDDDSEVTASLKPFWRPAFARSSDGALPESDIPQGVFLAASSTDDAFTARLKADLEERGIIVWNDRLKSAQNKLDQEDVLRQEIRAAQFVVVVISPHARTSRVWGEYLRIASMYERKLVFVWAAGDESGAVVPEAWGKTAGVDLIDARESRYGLALDEIAACLEEESAASVPFESGLAEPRNPYEGLRAFTRVNAADFFGRVSLIQKLTEIMRRMLTSSRRFSVRLSALLVGLVLLLLIGSRVIYYATVFRPNPLSPQATMTTQAQQITATAFANTPQGIYDNLTSQSPVLDDPLSQNDANTWDESRTPTYSCTFIAGSYHANLQLKGNLAECVAYSTNFGNFAYQTQMTILKGDSGGILFRFDSTKFRGYSFTIAQNGTYDLHLWDGSTGENLRSGSSSAIKTGLNQTNLIAVVASGSHIYLYVNKQFVTSVSESTFSSGQIGVQATENSFPTEVVFQHAQVWKV